MNTSNRQPIPWAMRLLMLLMLLMPLFILFLLPSGGLVLGRGWFWLALGVTFFVFWLISGGGRTSRVRSLAAGGPRMLYRDEQPALVHDLMEVQWAQEERGIRIFRGPLRVPAEQAYLQLKDTFAKSHTVMLQQDAQYGATVALLPKGTKTQAAIEKKVVPWVHWLLFALTLVTTTWAGAAHQGVDLMRNPGRFTAGLPYSLGLLAILGIHEMGHYLVARRHDMKVTPPFFIPIPFALGTFGAFIQMRTPSENRWSLFDVAIAGPLSGFAVALVALYLGLLHSEILPAGAENHGTAVGSSILFATLSRMALGPQVMWDSIIRLSPLAFAGWLGLMVTALNLLPIGQLDGGHVSHAMFGRRAGEVVSRLAMWSLLLLGLFVWPGLLTWAIIVFFIAGRAVPPLNDLTPLNFPRLALGLVAFVILILILAPMPGGVRKTSQISLIAQQINCPYL